MTTAVTVRRGEAHLVEGEMRHVFIDPTSRAKKEIPATSGVGPSPT